MSIITYGYSNARIRAMKAALLSGGFFKYLLSLEKIDEMINAFEGTPYEKDVGEGVLLYKGAKGIEEGLKKNLIKDFRKLITKVTSGQVREMTKLILGRWDVHNLKTIIRGKHIGASQKDIIESLIPAGIIGEPALLELTKRLDIKEVIDLLTTWEVPYAIPLRRNYFQYTKDREVANLEFALDKFYYKNAIRTIKGNRFVEILRRDWNRKVLLELFRFEIDFINIMTVLRLSREIIEEETIVQYFLENGKYIDRDMFIRLARLKATEDIVDSLKDTPYHAALKKGLQEYFTSGLVSPIQRRLEELIMRRSIELFKEYPLSIAPVIAYIWAKYNEVVNLRILVRCKAVKMPDDKIWGSLILVS